MAGTLLNPGDVVDSIVTSVAPFGVFVEHAGVPGLVRGVHAESGTVLRVRVSEYDGANVRFSALPA